MLEWDCQLPLQPLLSAIWSEVLLKVSSIAWLSSSPVPSRFSALTSSPFFANFLLSDVSVCWILQFALLCILWFQRDVLSLNRFQISPSCWTFCAKVDLHSSQPLSVNDTRARATPSGHCVPFMITQWLCSCIIHLSWSVGMIAAITFPLCSPQSDRHPLAIALGHTLPLGLAFWTASMWYQRTSPPKCIAIENDFKWEVKSCKHRSWYFC